MNRQHYEHHWTRLTRHIEFLEEKKDKLLFSGPTGVDNSKFYSQLREYRIQIGKYLRLRQVLTERFNTQH